MRTLFTFLTVFIKSKNMTFYVFSNAVARKCRPSTFDLRPGTPNRRHNHTALHFSRWHSTSGVLLKMEVSIRRGAWRRAWRYPAYLWSLRWVYAVQKNPGGWYTAYTRVYPPIHHCIALHFELSCGIWLWCRCGVPRLWTKVGTLVGHRNSGTHRGLTRIDFEPSTGQRSLTVFTDHRARSAFALKLHYFDSNQSVNF